jgi:predicted outer membrane lipoprotein
VQSDHGRIDFKWNAASHFAAVDHLRSQHTRNRLVSFGVPLATALVVIMALWVVEGGLTFDHVLQLLLFLAAFSILGAVAWAAFMSQPARRFLFRRGSTVPCALEFDSEGITVDIGKSPIRYPWSKVRSVAENSEYMFVLARSSACFAIPKATFASPAEAEKFAASMRRFLAP